MGHICANFFDVEFTLKLASTEETVPWKLDSVLCHVSALTALINDIHLNFTGEVAAESGMEISNQGYIIFKSSASLATGKYNYTLTNNSDEHKMSKSIPLSCVYSLYGSGGGRQLARHRVDSKQGETALLTVQKHLQSPGTNTVYLVCLFS